MRALLIANPKATTTSRRARDVLMRAFAGEVRLELAETQRRGHAMELAEQAVGEGYDVIIALGGDGTVNEAVNGLLAAGPSQDLPALAVVPSGSANVFARSLGLPNNALDAAGQVLEALRAGRHRTVGLGMADDRYFTFCAGLGLDAEVVHAVEQRRAAGSRAYSTLYIRTALRQFFVLTDRRRPALTLEVPGKPPLGHIFMGIVSNTSPWTYAGPWPVDPSPRAAFATGLDLFGLRRLDVLSTLNVLSQILPPFQRQPRGSQVLGLHDLTEFTLRSHRPIAFQVDGDYLGQRESVTFRSVPKAVRIVI
ncbi:diacylglycerol/lipid kinase family protein [Actinoallomurus rhizosphaericola]|uniref:diacylglycerol/lipid kinase family protein n=1 Tax=Actinoallomurus rhizosphaericola TaxID=2952536 RepID=UPI002090CC4F|nr:diacylglycerol kinase family protein [Actinoallomurus rhizosphaericola]MCO5991764.1 diacylglycerol kinase family lipid kinase [Actinoallomurus rhizosphaericola]